MIIQSCKDAFLFILEKITPSLQFCTVSHVNIEGYLDEYSLTSGRTHKMWHLSQSHKKRWMSVDIHKCNHSRLTNQSMAVKICLISHANTTIKDGFDASATVGW